MKKIGEILSSEQLFRFLRSLEEEFRLTEFGVARRLVENTAYFNYSVEFSITSENSYGKTSNIFLSVWGDEEYGYGLEFRWTTSSEHIMKMTGEYGENTKIDVLIGEDESVNFYPAVIRLLEDEQN